MRILQRLDEARLIVTDDVDNEPYLELAHDALILGWERLLNWVREDAPRIAALRLLTPNAEDWASSQQKKSGLLWSDAARIAVIKQLRVAATPGLNAIENSFAQASEKRALRNFAIRWGAVAAIVVLAFSAAIAAYLANKSADAAKEALASSQLSQSQFLADQSSRLTDSGNGQAGLLLAAAALPMGDKSCRINRPVSEEAVLALYKATQSTREIATFDQSAPDISDPGRGSEKVAGDADIREVYRAIFSPDKQYLLTVGQDGTARLWNIASRTFSVIYRSSKNNFPYEADFSPDGNLIAIGVTDGGVLVYNRNTGILLTAEALHRMLIQRIRFSPTGKLIATVSADYSARLWATDGRSIKPLPIIVKHQGPVIDVAFNQSETQIVTTDRVGGAVLTSLVDGHHVSLVGHGNGAIFQGSFSPDGALVVTASEDRTARLWKTKTGEFLGAAEGHTDALSRARFDPTGHAILTASRDGTARIWRVVDGVRLQPSAVLRGHTARLYDAVFSKSGSRVVTASDDGTARIWNVEALQNDLKTDRAAQSRVEDVAAEAVLSGHTSWVYSVVFSADDELIATASHDGTARVWSATGPRDVQHVSAHASPITVLRHDPRFRRLLTGSQNGELKLWDLDSLSPIGSFKAHDRSITTAEFSANGLQIITGGADGRAILWKMGSQQPQATLVDNGDLISSVSFSPTHDIVSVTSYDKSVRLFDSNDGSELHELRGHGSWVKGGTFSPDGKSLLTWSIDGIAIVWDPLKGQQIGAVKLCESSVEQAAFSPDGSEIIGACVDGTLAMWRGGTAVKRIQAHDKAIRRFAFSYDGTQLVSGADGGGVAIWSVQDLHCIKKLGGHDEDITFVEFLSSNSHVISGSQDRTVKIWEAVTNEVHGIFSGHRRGVVGAAIDRVNRQLITASGLELLRFRLFDEVGDLIAYAEANLSTRALSGPERKRFGLGLGNQCAAAVK